MQTESVGLYAEGVCAHRSHGMVSRNFIAAQKALFVLGANPCLLLVIASTSVVSACPCQNIRNTPAVPADNVGSS